MWDYTKETQDHFLHPRNVGELADADAVGEVGSLACGDALRLFLKLDENENIVDARFQTFGCASAIASASALTEIIKGMNLKDAGKVTNQKVAEYLKGLPEQKMHCSVLAREALEAAIHNYRTGETGVFHKEGKVVCHCFGVTDEEIREVARENGLTTVAQITDYIKAGGGCGGCIDEIQAIVDEVTGKTPAAAPPASEAASAPAPHIPERLTNVQRILRVQNVLDTHVKPHLNRDGGDIELVDVDGVTVTVRLSGVCASCPMSNGATKEMIQSQLREHVEPELTVEIQK